ncbi:hypothetical protein KA405_03510 [Patescibacteria group bacterium]|nr:hypothetical protein [Patescibacteria group bacterium]
MQDQAIKVEQNKTAQLKNNDTKVLEQQLNQFGKLANKLNDKKETFVKIAEEKLHNIIVDAKEHGRELHSEPITKIHTPWNEALIEVHLINEI